MNMKKRMITITKETFCKALSKIKEQELTDSEFSKTLSKIGDGHFVFGAGNKYLEALLMVLKEGLNDKYEYIEWWLYEANDDYTVWSEDNSISWKLKEPEVLYDYIVNECN